METCKNRAKRISLAIKEAVKKGGFKIIEEQKNALVIEVKDGYKITASIIEDLAIVNLYSEFMELNQSRDFIIELLNELNSSTQIGGFTVKDDKIGFEIKFSYKDSLISSDAMLSYIKSMQFCIIDVHSIILSYFKTPDTIRYYYEEYLFLGEERACLEMNPKEKISKRFSQMQRALDGHYPFKRVFPFTSSASFEQETENIPLNICVCTALEIGTYIFNCNFQYNFKEKLGAQLSSNLALFLSNLLKLGNCSVKYGGHLEISIQLPF